MSVSGNFPNSSWLLLGGERGLFAIDQRDPDAGFQALNTDMISSVVAISGRYVATSSGAIFQGELRQNMWRWTLVAQPGLSGFDEDEESIELYDIETLKDRLLLVTNQGIVSITGGDLHGNAADTEGEVFEYYSDSFVSFPKEPVVRHITSAGEVAFFYSLGALRELH